MAGGVAEEQRPWVERPILRQAIERRLQRRSDFT